MGDTNTKTRAEELAEEFKDGLDKDGAVKLAERVDALEAELADTKEKLKKSRAETRAAKKVTRGEASGELRKLGETVSDRSGEEIAEAIAEADKVEIAFSDGRREVPVAPVNVSGDAWRAHPRGQMLSEPVEVKGTDAPFQIDGYALLIDGKQIAYAKRSEPLNVAPGTRITLVDDIVF